jgi:outer membrane lipoprotein-sorting protein
MEANSTPTVESLGARDVPRLAIDPGAASVDSVATLAGSSRGGGRSRVASPAPRTARPSERVRAGVFGLVPRPRALTGPLDSRSTSDMLRKTLAGFALMALIVSPAFAQTADELVAKNIAARGGMEKLKAVKSARVTGKMVMGQGMEAPFVMMEKRPKLSRMEFTFQGMTGVQAFDGKNGWSIMPFMGKKEPEAAPAEENELLDEQSDIDGPLVDYKDKGHKVELLGKEQVEGADAYKLKLTLKSGKTRTIYLDADSYLEVKMEAKRTMRGNEVEGETTYGDYKEEGGLMVAHTIESGAKGAPQKQKLVFEKFEMNTDLPDSLFAMPAGTKPAAPPTAKADAAKADEATKTAEATKVEKTADQKAADAEAEAKATIKTDATKKTETAKKKKP